MTATLFDNAFTGPDEHRFTLHEIVEGFGMGLGLDDYPIWKEEYREHLNQTIYEHFMFRRIAAPTPQMFVFYLNRRMRERMPAYNEIYKKLAETDSPFDTYEETRQANTAIEGQSARATHDEVEGTQDVTGHSDTSSESTESASTNSDSLATNTTSNTPASYMENPYDPKYMSSLAQSKSNATGSSEGESASKGTEDSTNETRTRSEADGTDNANHSQSTDYLSKVNARSGFLADVIESSLSQGFLNTDLMVCDMLEPCFMQVWDDQPIF